MTAYSHTAQQGHVLLIQGTSCNGHSSFCFKVKDEQVTLITLTNIVASSKCLLSESGAYI